MIIKRDILSVIDKHLAKEDALLIIGPRQAGKTTVLHQVENNLKKDNDCFFVNLEDPEYLQLLNKSPKNLFEIFSINLNKKTYVFVDEVQYLKDPSNFIKFFVDEYKGRIKIIASGSSAFYLDSKFKDSMVGRKILITMFPLSFKEFFFFKNNEVIEDFKKISLSQKEKIRQAYFEYLVFGGYPKVVLAETKEEKIENLKEIAYSYIKKDIYEYRLRQDETFYKLFKILASQVGGMVNSFELANTLDVSKTVIKHYLSVMQKSFHVFVIHPFFNNVRKEITKMPKIYFIDNGLRSFFLNDFKGYLERPDSGQMLENDVFREFLNINNQEDIKFWRTSDGKEIDFIIKGKEAFEVKAKVANLKENNFKVFLDNYKIKPKIISLEEKEMSNGCEIIKPWDILS
ncbi:MAG: ATP-binding protein [Candidatus Paceibacterota bacterium]|jgi:hypothetical protein